VSDPFTAFNFRVEILLPGAAEPLCEAAFAECDGLELRHEVIKVREGGDASSHRLFAGSLSFGEITLRRGMTESFDLWKWFADPSLRADARVTILAEDGDPRAVFLLRRCLPVRLKAPRLDAMRSAVAVEELQIACEALALQGAEPDRPKLQKATLHELDEKLAREVGKPLVVPFNPRDLRLVHAEGGARLALDLWLEGEPVRELSARVARFAPPGPPLRFAWGRFRFDGRVETLEQTFDLFAPDGEPLRARLALALRGEKPSQMS
jgi:phage tail-like protein